MSNWITRIKNMSDAEYDYEDIDCSDCGLKFFVRPSDYTHFRTNDGRKPWPTQCPRCVRGLPPLYEY